MYGRDVPVRADVVDLPAFSVHADSEELVAWLGTASPWPDEVYLVHGEPESAAALADRIEAEHGRRPVVAGEGTTVPLT